MRAVPLFWASKQGIGEVAPRRVNMEQAAARELAARRHREAFVSRSPSYPRKPGFCRALRAPVAKYKVLCFFYFFFFTFFFFLKKKPSLFVS